MEDEGEEMVPVFQCPRGAGANRFIFTRFVVEAEPLHAPPDEGGCKPQLITGQDACQEGVPVCEEPVDFGKHAIGEGARARTAARLAKGDKLANDVRPTQLPESVVV